MITATESGLPPHVHEALMAAEQFPALSVLAYQYNPSFSGSPHVSVTSTPSLPSSFSDYGGKGYRIRDSVVEEILQDGTVTNLGYPVPGTRVATEPLSIAADSTGVAVFAICTDGLKRSLWDGSSWSTTTLPVAYTKTYSFYTDTIFDQQGIYSTGLNPTFAFDNVFTNYWSAISLPAQLGGTTGNLAATRYRMVSGSTADSAPKSWTFEGWNGSSWITLDTRSNQPAWFPFESRTYHIANTTAYTRYRINVSAVFSGTTLQVAVLEADLKRDFSLSPDLTLLAAATPNAVFYLREVPSRNLFLLCGAIYEDGAWSYKESDIYYPGKFPEMQAAVRPEGGYVILAQAYIPGPQTIKSTGAGTETYVYKKQGIISFLFEYNTFSDHFEVDISDFFTSWRKRQFITLTNYGGLLYMVAQVTDGSEEYPNALYQVYTTKDGRFWSIGEAFYVSTHYHSPVKLVPSGQTILALMNDRGYRSPHTRIFGGSAISIDLTPDIESAQINFGEIASGQLDLANETLQYNNNPNFNQDNHYEIEFYSGYYVNGVKTIVRVLYGDVELISHSRSDAHERIVRVAFQDFMSRMNDRFKSRNAREIRTHLVFQDDFTNTIDNVYGGLRNTASQEGSWESQNYRISGRTGDGVSTTEGEAIAFSTATIDSWNGVQEAWLGFAQEGSPTLNSSSPWFIWYSQEPRKRMETIWDLDPFGAQVNMPIGWTPPYYDSNQNFSGYIMGYIKSKAATGNYDLKLEYAGQASVYIDNTLIINGFEKPSVNISTLTGVFDFGTGDKWYPLYIPFATWPENGVSAIKLYWSPPGESEALVPSANLAKTMTVDAVVYNLGVVFRAIDKRNFYSYVYQPTTESTSLRLRRDGLDKEIDHADLTALGWDNDPESPHKLYVSFRYGHVRCYSNNEYGHPRPLLCIDHLLDMRQLKDPDAQGLVLLKDSLPEAGYVGYVARGV